VALRSFTIDVDDVGKLAVDAKLSGIPLTDLTNEEAAKKVLATGKLESFHFRFDNSGVVEKLLKMLAEQSGAKPEEVVGQFMQPILAFLAGNQAFQDKVSAAISTFIKDPKSIAFSATPSQPVPFPAIIGAAAAGPQIIPDMIGANITANQ
jgi:hypothetical protein